MARLLTDGKLAQDLAETFAPGARIAFNFAPPFLNGATVNGRPKKREFSAKILPVLRILAKLRGLRGTRFDLFGYSAERRMERRLIADYETLTRDTVGRLSAENSKPALALLAAADAIRGFGPVKADAVRLYDAQLPTLRAAFEAPPASPAAAAA